MPDQKSTVSMNKGYACYTVQLMNSAWVGLHNKCSNMHGATLKIVDAKQARLHNNCKNTKCKLLKTNAAIWFNLLETKAYSALYKESVRTAL